MARPAGTPARTGSLEEFELEAETLRALAHPKRLRLLAALGDHGATVTELSDALALPLPNVSQHLRVLRDRGIVRAERSGQLVRYHIVNPAFLSCCALVRRMIVQEAERRQSELHLEAPPAPPVERSEEIAA